MAILAFQKPNKVLMLSSDAKKGRFEFKPLEPGYGVTVGNAIRRILLSSLEGFAITSIKIEGVDHEFASIDGVIEDVTEMILNLKKIRFKRKIEDFDSEQITVNIQGQDSFTGEDINKFITGFDVLNPELLICRMDKKTSLKINLTIEKGRGYVPSEELQSEFDEIGWIPIDSIFTPIKNVKFLVDNFRVEQKTDYEKLLIEIESDGSISPKDALKEAARILIQHFMLFSDERITLEEESGSDIEEFNEETLHMRQLLQSKLFEMDLTVRAKNCLKAADVNTLGQLVQFQKSDLLKFRNFGKKSLGELEALLVSLNLSFGMDVAKYKLDK